jgi:hypothetical protein
MMDIFISELWPLYAHAQQLPSSCAQNQALLTLEKT